MRKFVESYNAAQEKARQCLPSIRVCLWIEAILVVTYLICAAILG